MQNLFSTCESFCCKTSQSCTNCLAIVIQLIRTLNAVLEQGPEIRTGFLEAGKPIQLVEGQELVITTDYSIKGNSKMISMSYKKLPQDLEPGSTILCSDGTITLTVLSTDPATGTVNVRCENTAVLGERKNVNLPGVVVDLPTLTEKDKEDIMQWGVPNKIDLIALSFVRKGSDLVTVRDILGKHSKSIKLMSKVSSFILAVAHQVCPFFFFSLGGFLGGGVHWWAVAEITQLSNKEKSRPY